MRCSAVIPLDAKCRSNTYCMLEPGHKGNHDPQPRKVVAPATSVRPQSQCTYMNASGHLCPLPLGHPGDHGDPNGQ